MYASIWPLALRWICGALIASLLLLALGSGLAIAVNTRPSGNTGPLTATAGFAAQRRRQPERPVRPLAVQIINPPTAAKVGDVLVLKARWTGGLGPFIYNWDAFTVQTGVSSKISSAHALGSVRSNTARIPIKSGGLKTITIRVEDSLGNVVRASIQVNVNGPEGTGGATARSKPGVSCCREARDKCPCKGAHFMAEGTCMAMSPGPPNTAACNECLKKQCPTKR